ncbi:MAG TPA: cysteine desulfurase family protein [Clostridia bacterium]|nr:cysteine desulfurase family protein [Clostridia bacterium]
MIYFDNSATTPVRKEVYEAMLPYLTFEYGNPSSKYYKLATNAKYAVEEARESVAKLIGAKPEEIIFTSGASESTNMIIKGITDYSRYYVKKGNHIITSKVEHKATLNTCKFLNGDIYSNNDSVFKFGMENPKVDRGYEVSFLDVNQYGQVLPETLEAAIKDTTSIVSLIWGNNEIGTLNDALKLGSICYSKNVPLHLDATQMLGKMEIDVNKINVDSLSMSAHKVHGPKGIGAAYLKCNDYGLPPFSSLLHGGGQEKGLRGSTLPVHNIVGFGKACEISLNESTTTLKYYKELDIELIKLFCEMPNIKLLGDLANRVPGIYSLLIDKKDFNNEMFLKKISGEFAISSGSACSAGEPSHVLQAIGLGEYTSKVIRISIGSSMPLKKTTKSIQELLNKI